MPTVQTLASSAALRAADTRRVVGGALAGARSRTEPGCVALTFDDGPHPGTTDRVLELLGRLGVPATFFCVGRNAGAHPELVRRALDEGHAVGSHSQTHPFPPDLSVGRLTADYDAGRSAVSSAAGREVHLFRPPHGRISPRGAWMLRRRPVTPWLWSMDAEDWRGDRTAEEIAAVAGSARSGEVVLLHDWVQRPWTPAAVDRSATVDALPEIVARIRARGLRITRLPS